MKQVSLAFEPPDLAGWLWLVVGLLILLEAARFVLAGRRPATLGARLVPIGVAAVVLAALRIGGYLRFQAASHLWACAWLGLLTVPWLLRAYRWTGRPLPRRRRLALLTLRLVGLLVILLLLAGPVLQSVEVRRERAVVGIVLDDSRSMTVRDATPGAGNLKTALSTRLDAVRNLLAANQRALDRLAGEVDVRWFAFDSKVREMNSPVLAGNGELTALAESIDAVHRLLGQNGAKVAAVVVVSDGRDTSVSGQEGHPQLDPTGIGDQLAKAGVPIYAVGVGSDLPVGQTRSLQARRLVAPQQVGVLNRLAVTAEFLSAGLAGQPIKVALLLDNAVVDQRQVQPTQVRELIRVDLQHVPSEGGVHRLTVRATAEDLPPGQGQAVLSQFVRVTQDKVQVLYVDRARYERAAIARALESARELNVTKLDLNRPVAAQAPSELPQTVEALRRYHVVLLGDVDRRAMTDKSLQALHDLVTVHGRGLAMLGGLRTIGSGKYRDTPLAKALPVDLGVIGHWPPPVAFELTPAGKAHPICQLKDSPPLSEATWKRLPPFTGATRLTRLSPAAETLIQSPSEAPLLVVQESGPGRVAVVAFDSTWQWSFADDEGAEAQRRFWRQLVLWLANRRGEVWVTSDKPQYDLARLRAGLERITLRAGVTEPPPAPNPRNITITGQLVGPGGQADEIRWLSKSEGVEARPAVERAGEYRVLVQAKAGSDTLARSETAFVVESVDRELADPLADLDTLRRMAGQTGQIGGRFVPLEEFGRLLEQLRAAGHVTEIRHVRRCALTDEHPWWWIVAFVALLTCEWVLRRRAGLL